MDDGSGPDRRSPIGATVPARLTTEGSWTVEVPKMSIAPPADLLRRVGAFGIAAYVVRDYPAQALAMLDGVLVTEARAVFHTDAIHYVGHHPSFDVIGLGEMPPTYTPRFVRRGDRDVFDGWVRASR